MDRDHPPGAEERELTTRALYGDEEALGRLLVLLDTVEAALDQ